ncbi:MAG: MFS transporter [Roseburia sp.]|nr:MFS transporter [Roseburia sp.]
MSENLSPKPQKLWTRDFTIITVGSVISMMGSMLTVFALSLLVLDFTQSPLYFALYLASYNLPQIIMPIFSGAILDRFSRRKAIYTLDFISTGLYLLAAWVMWMGWFNFPVLACFCFVLGSISSMYNVAYQSFYPLLISPGNFSKAYSISGLLENLAVIMVPVSALIYRAVGIVPILVADGLTYCIAAILETRITAHEEYVESQRLTAGGVSTGRRLLRDIKEGFEYLVGERGLLMVAVYFTFSALSQGAATAVTLPFFKSYFVDGASVLLTGEYLFLIVQGASVLGRGLGSIFHYRVQMPARWKYRVALAVYMAVGVIGGVYLYLPLPVMIPLFFVYGLLGITSYTIRISATQSYVPDEKKGRFNGAFNMLSTTGNLVGTLLAGTLTEFLPVRQVLLGFCLLEAVMAAVLIGGNRRSIAPIYNRQQ